MEMYWQFRFNLFMELYWQFRFNLLLWSCTDISFFVLVLSSTVSLFILCTDLLTDHVYLYWQFMFNPYMDWHHSILGLRERDWETPVICQCGGQMIHHMFSRMEALAQAHMLAAGLCFCCVSWKTKEKIPHGRMVLMYIGHMNVSACIS